MDLLLYPAIHKNTHASTTKVDLLSADINIKLSAFAASVLLISDY